MPPLAAHPLPAPVVPGRGPPVELDDRLVRAIGIPSFGLVIPRVSGLLDGVPAAAPAYWLGSLAFVALAAAIWHGNRWLLFEQRRHYGWFDHPARKVVLLLGAVVLFTVPLTVAALVAWYGTLGRPPAWPVVRTVVLINVICVVFVTHVYETVFLIKEREGDLVRVAELDRARAEALLAAFVAQVDPHFLFNSLNTLGHLVDTDPARARAFTDRLAALYRYLLRHRGDTLVGLDDELGFVADYVALMQVRFGDALVVAVHDGGVDRRRRLPPTALQLLIENAIKHNAVGEGRPLAIEVRLEETWVRVEHERAPRRRVRASAGLGLRNLDERARLATGRGIVVREGDGRFVVEVPLVGPKGAP